jgi:hypothetical protein
MKEEGGSNNESNGIDVSALLKETRTKDKKRIKIFNEFGSVLYGN